MTIFPISGSPVLWRATRSFALVVSCFVRRIGPAVPQHSNLLRMPSTHLADKDPATDKAVRHSWSDLGHGMVLTCSVVY